MNEEKMIEHYQFKVRVVEDEMKSDSLDTTISDFVEFSNFSKAHLESLTQAGENPKRDIKKMEELMDKKYKAMKEGTFYDSK
ncbi:hypothetical protein HNV12_03855 [Methanococcoides sp. SA1]|nr:hypothetical protein [Methanococcoides sp. SA1]